MRQRKNRSPLRKWENRCACGLGKHKDARECVACASRTAARHTFQMDRFGESYRERAKAAGIPVRELRQIARVHSLG